jgi:predicted nucleic acid-binding Zn ribbon protein
MSPWKPLRPEVPPEPVRVGDSLDGVARRLGAPAASALGKLFSAWPEVVGESIAAHSRPLSLVDGVLTVAVDQPGWATQLKYLGNDVVAKLADSVGPGVVGRLEVRVEGAPKHTSRRTR